MIIKCGTINGKICLEMWIVDSCLDMTEGVSFNVRVNNPHADHIT